MVRIRLERIDIQKKVMVETLLDSRVIEFDNKFGVYKKTKVLNWKRPIYVRNINIFFNKKKPIKYIVEINMYY